MNEESNYRERERERERDNLILGILISFVGEQSQFAQINKRGTRSI